MSRKVVKAVFRFDPEVEDWLAVAKCYCIFLNGKDKRGRGYGSSPTELKAVEKQILNRFKSVEACRQWLAKQRIAVIENGQGIRLFLGVDKDSFQKAVDNAFKWTANWKTEENIVVLFDSMSQAQRAIEGKEAFIAGLYSLS